MSHQPDNTVILRLCIEIAICWCAILCVCIANDGLNLSSTFEQLGHVNEHSNFAKKKKKKRRHRFTRVPWQVSSLPSSFGHDVLELDFIHLAYTQLHIPAWPWVKRVNVITAKGQWPIVCRDDTRFALDLNSQWNRLTDVPCYSEMFLHIKTTKSSSVVTRYVVTSLS